MKSIVFMSLLALAGANNARLQRRFYTHDDRQVRPTIWVAGDSTTAPGGGGNGTQGWGQYLQYSFPEDVAFVNNSAWAGTSARSFTREGRFEAIAEEVKAGDFIVIEFGHNDGGSPYPAADDNGRADCPGFGGCFGAAERCSKFAKSK